MIVDSRIQVMHGVRDLHRFSWRFRGRSHIAFCSCGWSGTDKPQWENHLDQVRLDALDKWETEQRKMQHPLGPSFAKPIPDDAMPDRRCNHCDPDYWGMVLCQICGNKRCPHATHHANLCTRSNEPGQTGSAYQ